MSKTFQVVKNLSIRTAPGINNDRVGAGLTPGTIIQANADSRQEVDGYVWWQHDQGWSAERKVDGSMVYMEAMDEPDPAPTTEPITPSEPETLKFNVKTLVRIRMSPGISGVPVQDVYLQPDTIIDIVPTSRTELDGYIWWQHSQGWSAAQSSDGNTVFMVQIDDDAPVEAAEPDPTPATERETQEAPAAVKETRTGTVTREFRVMLSVKVRKSPGLSGEELPDRLQPGVIVQVDQDSRTEVDGYVWWQHDLGWSAGSNLDGSTVFFGDPDAPEPGSAEAAGSPDGVTAADGSISVDDIPQRDQLFTRLPVDINQTAWVQYFGNTNFAFNNGARWGYDKFAQGLHSGFDFGNGTNNFSGSIPVFAGVTGTFIRNNNYGVAVQSGQFVVIYQHVSQTNSYVKGGQVTQDTQIGILDPSMGSNRHLHLEVRYRGEVYIINPLLMMPEAMRNALLQRFTRYDMCSANGWTQWQTPMDQPIIILGGPVVGPTA